MSNVEHHPVGELRENFLHGAERNRPAVLYADVQFLQLRQGEIGKVSRAVGDAFQRAVMGDDPAVAGQAYVFS